MEPRLQNLYGGALPIAEDRAEPVWQVWLFRLVVGLFVASRVVLAWHQTIGSDESQHAHVAWAWVHGFVQYRDVFDNHTPLFHLLSAPLVALIGERADILALLRCCIIGFLPLRSISMARNFAPTSSGLRFGSLGSPSLLPKCI